MPAREDAKRTSTATEEERCTRALFDLFEVALSGVHLELELRRRDNRPLEMLEGSESELRDALHCEVLARILQSGLPGSTTEIMRGLLDTNLEHTRYVPRIPVVRDLIYVALIAVATAILRGDEESSVEAAHALRQLRTGVASINTALRELVWADDTAMNWFADWQMATAKLATCFGRE